MNYYTIIAIAIIAGLCFWLVATHLMLVFQIILILITKNGNIVNGILYPFTWIIFSISVFVGLYVCAKLYERYYGPLPAAFQYIPRGQ